MKDTPPRKESKVPLSAQPALSSAERIFVEIIMTIVKSGAIPASVFDEQTPTPQADEPGTRQ